MVTAMNRRNARDSAPGSIQVVSRSAAVLRALRDHPDGCTLSQLSRAVSLPRSTVHRLLAALQVEGLIAANADGLSVIGPEIHRIAGGPTVDVADVIRPALRTLFEELDETVDLAVLEGDHLRFVDQIPAPHRLRAVSAVGATFPLHCTANGKAVLAALSDDQILRLLPEELSRFTPSTTTSRRALLAEIASTRATGLAIDREEHTDGICAMGFAAPVVNGNHFAITVPIPRQRFDGREAVIAAALGRARTEVATVLAARQGSNSREALGA